MTSTTALCHCGILPAEQFSLIRHCILRANAMGKYYWRRPSSVNGYVLYHSIINTHIHCRLHHVCLSDMKANNGEILRFVIYATRRRISIRVCVYLFFALFHVSNVTPIDTHFAFIVKHTNKALDNELNAIACDSSCYKSRYYICITKGDRWHWHSCTHSFNQRMNFFIVLCTH